VIRQGLVVVLTGITLGLAGTLALARTMQSLLFGVHARDAVSFAAAAGIMLAVALRASYLPAHRAASIDPSLTLRAE
jgi:putative ABC transport system permease protein